MGKRGVVAVAILTALFVSVVAFFGVYFNSPKVQTWADNNFNNVSKEDLNNKITDLEAELAEKQLELDTANGLIVEKEAIINSLLAEKEALTDQLNNLQAEILEKQENLETVNTELEQLLEEKTTLITDNEALDLMVIQLTNQKEELIADKNALENELAQVRYELSLVKAENAELKATIWTGEADTSFLTNNYNEEQSGYLINTAEELAGVQAVYADNSLKSSLITNKFILQNDIFLNRVSDMFVDGELVEDTSNLNQWTPINASNTNIEFIGNNHTIYGLYINVTDNTSNLGLFSDIKTAKFSNLTMGKGYINGGSNVGGFAGSMSYGYDTVFDNCHNYVDITSYRMSAGGFIGSDYADPSVRDVVLSFINCTNSGDIKLVNGFSVYSGVGGFVGMNLSCNLNFTSCANSGDIHFDNIDNENNFQFGSMFGYNHTSRTINITQCSNTGKFYKNNTLLSSNYVFYGNVA